MNIESLNSKNNFFYLKHFSDSISDETLEQVKNVMENKLKIL